MAGNPLRNQETAARGLTATVSMSSITHCNLLFYCLSSLPLLESGQPSNHPGVGGGKAQVQLTCVQEDVQGFGFSPQRCCVYCSEINTILGVLNYFYFSLSLFLFFPLKHIVYSNSCYIHRHPRNKPACPGEVCTAPEENEWRILLAHQKPCL